MLIENSNLNRHSLEGQIALVSGAGRGIGLETARALLWLGACVIVAEIDEQLAQAAEAQLGREFDPARIVSIRVDIGDEAGVRQMAQQALRRFGRVDIVINNATVTPMGAAWDVPIEAWDHSYRVNLRGPVLLAQQFIPGMRQRNYGVFACVSSVGQAYMGAYESFKAAQVHLANTLDAELEGTDVCAFTIGPGLVRTPGADAGIAALAPLYGKSVADFYEMGKDHII
jgi:NAD(P)-dependent dehydrogenase (short-subunit alcohol dehydrogenase family)